MEEEEMLRLHASCVIQACWRGQLGRRRVLALLTARDEVLLTARNDVLRERRKAERDKAARRTQSSQSPRRGEASAKLHVRRTRAGGIADRAHRVAVVAEARREVAEELRPVEETSLDALLDDACLELRGWARACPGLGNGDVGLLLAECERSASASLLGVTVAELRELSLHIPQQAELSSLLQECEQAVLSRRDHALAAPADRSALADTMAELRALCASRPEDEELALLMRECSAESDRREGLSRSVTLGDVAATEMQISELLAQASTRCDGQRQEIEQLRGLREECRREIRSQNNGRRRQRSSAS